MSQLKLVVGREIAKGRISQQITKGRELSERDFQSLDLLASIIPGNVKWSTVNRGLLGQFFSNDSLASQYPRKHERELKGLTSGVFEIDRALHYFREHLDRELNYLESVLELLDSIPEEESRSGSASGKPPPALDIFISHASRDKDIAQSLIDLLRAALSVPAERIRCTSVDGYRLPIGAETKERLRQEVHDAKAFIGLITKASLQSAFVMFELGARWGAGVYLAPLVTTEEDKSLLREPLSGLNALSCDSRAQVLQLVEDIAKVLDVRPSSTAAYDKYAETLVQQCRAERDAARVNDFETPTI